MVNGGEDAYDSKIGRTPFPTPPVEATSWASDQPAVSVAPFAINRCQYCGHPAPYFAMVASKNASPGEEVDAPGVTKRFLYSGWVRSSSVRGSGRWCLRNQTSSTFTQTSP